jgi:enolase-phosphatase E1
VSSDAVPKAIVTDIEGTTSSLSFVHEVLFPYSRARLADFVAAHPAEVATVLDEVRAETGQPDLDRDSCIARLLEWHAADRKITPLKTLQGMIWAEGFAAGALKGHVYADAAAGLRRWHARGIALYVYSSGSVAAQLLVFGHTDFGDLTPLFSGHFDTTVGAKKEAASYGAIARAIGCAPAEILFLSDVTDELAAAWEAGFQVMLLARDGVPQAGAFPVVASFDAILPTEAGA